MIKIENVEIFGWEAAIRGMRNPMNSWDKSDSYPAVDCGKCGKIEREGTCKKEDRNCSGYECFEIGPNDLDLMKRLAKAGTDHRKFMRMIIVYLDITAPMYWWKQFDTYRIGVEKNACSTMHKLHAKRIMIDDFSKDYIWDETIQRPLIQLNKTEDNPVYLSDADILIYMVAMLNECQEMYFKTNDKRYWYKMIQLLPSSYDQKRTVMLSFEVLANMYHARKNHKLDEWREFCDWIESLPYSELITGKERTMEFADGQGLKNAAAPAC